MTYDPDRHHRRSNRLRGYDYSRAGAYFVTSCTRTRECLFGEVRDGQMHLNDLGHIVAESWIWLADQYAHVDLDAYVVMPNHIHGIIVLSADGSGAVGTSDSPAGDSQGRGGSRTAPTPDAPGPTVAPKRKPLGRLIGAFKTVSAKRIGQITDLAGAYVWHRDFYDHIIRNEKSLARIRQYIANNPARWAEDRLHPDHPDPFPPPPHRPGSG
jgi:REP element-mobilizing transposase RayT